MSFLSLTFLLLFLPVCALVRYLPGNRSERLRGICLLTASLVFVFFVQAQSLAAVAYTVVVCYFSALLLNKKAKTVVFVCGLVLTVLPLCVLKYGAFFASLLGKSVTLPSAPAGISFFTFLAVSYLTDVYRGRIAAEKDPLPLTLYFTAMPKFLQGPLTRYDASLPQKPDWDACSRGAERFILGLGKKLLLSGICCEAAARLLDGGTICCPGAWLGAVFYAMQIYFDFSGYTDMAIGLGAVFGLTLPENFDLPYLAQSVTDFWRRWHVTLSQWFRDYIYIPLGGNRRGLARQLFNLLIVWLLTGLWHGASVNFVLWGLYYAVILGMEKLFLGRLLQRLPKLLRHLYALFCILLGWVIFRSEGLSQIGRVFGAMFTGGGSSDAAFILRQYGLVFAVGIFVCSGLGKKLLDRLEKTRFGTIVRLLFLLAVFALCILARTANGVSSFIYAQF